MVDSQSMGMNPGGFSLAGAVDLEGVKRKAEALAKREAAAKSGKPQSKMPSACGYVIDVNEQTFQAMVQTSVSFPIILLVWQKSDETSYDLAQKLADSITALDGRMQLARIDADESPSIAQALRAQQLPAVYGLVGGRPMPICQGLPSADELQQICNDILTQLVKVAEKSGVAGMAPYVDSGDSADDSGVGNNSADSADSVDSSDVPPEHKIAHEAAMNGDYALAASEYEKVLQANPNDSLASRDDQPAIRALQAALADHDTMRLIRAAQDVVTLLAQAGIYMDELAPEPGPAAVWRAFAEVLRGPQVAVLGGVSDPAALEVSAHLLRSDEIFRDAAHHFLRQFDRMMARVAPDLDDDFLAALTETRSGRAFVLLAQTSGIFGAGPADGGT